MKIDLSRTFEDLDGVTLKESQAPDAKPLTAYQVLRVCVTQELAEDTAGAATSAIETKMKNFDIFLECKKTGPEGMLELTAEQIAHIKPRLAKIFAVLVTGPMLNILEGKEPYGTPVVISKAH